MVGKADSKKLPETKKKTFGTKDFLRINKSVHEIRTKFIYPL